MMRDYYVILLTVLASSVVQPGQSSKCNQRVISNVLNLWRNNRTPISLKDQLIEARVSYIVATTPGVFHDENNIQCLKAITTKSGNYFMIILFNNGSVQVTDTYRIEELGTDLYSPEDEQHRYHIPTNPNSNVQAFYTCREEGSPGEDRGLIRVLRHSNTLTKAAIKKAVNDFADVGIPISTFYPDHCEDIHY